jgi:hypothetical protein
MVQPPRSLLVFSVHYVISRTAPGYRTQLTWSRLKEMIGHLHPPIAHHHPPIAHHQQEHHPVTTVISG